MLSEAALASFIVTLFSMMNPIGGLAIVASLTADRTPSEIRRIAWTCALATAVTLTVVAWAGSSVLAVFGITVDALRAGGGLIVLLIGLNMLNNRDAHRHSDKEDEDAHQRESIAVVPLAIPMVAGPGTMISVLVASQQQPDLLARGEITGVILAMSALIGLLFSAAPQISKYLGASGIGVATRVMGMLLVAMAFGMLAEGLNGLMPGLAG